MKFLLTHFKARKKTALALLTAGLVFTGILVQDQVLRVKAAVQVLLVSHTAIPFGTVFPGETVDETYTVQIDNSIPRAVYYTTLEPVEGKLNLCPLLDLVPVDNPPEGDTVPTSTVELLTDPIDSWQVTFNVPAIEGSVAQDHDGRIVVESGDYECKIIIITYPPEGCTPGYWKQKQHFDSWPAPYAPTTAFSSVFENAFPGKNLLQVLNLGGGGLNALGRHTVAALLSAAQGDVNYAYTTQEVISLFNSAFPGTISQYNALKDQFAVENERGCPLN